ncbi:MAG: hypothetical protein IT376_13065 [Polyangiaceae bacterium]|nr:hypothetical protein [Polyangiaceae bacterium]
MRFTTLLMGHHDDHMKARLSAALDRMDAKSRLATCLSIEPKEQRVLWDLFEDSTLDASHFVPPGLEPLREVIHHGKNTLPAHNFFQKRFCRAPDDSADLYGYNHQSLSAFTGPGYFVAHPVDREREKSAPTDYVIDYTRLPPKKAEPWPEILPNEARLGRFVYAGMKDYMRKVSDHVSVGRAYKQGPMNAWFLLCREDPAS